MREKRFGFVSGTSNSGKSATFGTLAAAAGDYAATAPDEALFGNVSDHPAWLARLRGRRLLWIDEAPTMPWRTSRVKAITGGQPVQARFMRQDPIEFTPTVKLIAAANGLPRIPEADSGFASRLVLIPLQRVIPESERAPGFERQLKQELPVILQWAVEGATRYLDHGLPAPPQAWTAAGEDYVQGEDTAALWAERCLADVPDRDGWLPRVGRARLLELLERPQQQASHQAHHLDHRQDQHRHRVARGARDHPGRHTRLDRDLAA